MVAVTRGRGAAACRGATAASAATPAARRPAPPPTAHARAPGGAWARPRRPRRRGRRSGRRSAGRRAGSDSRVSMLTTNDSSGGRPTCRRRARPARGTTPGLVGLGEEHGARRRAPVGARARRGVGRQRPDLAVRLDDLDAAVVGAHARSRAAARRSAPDDASPEGAPARNRAASCISGRKPGRIGRSVHSRSTVVVSSRTRPRPTSASTSAGAPFS